MPSTRPTTLPIRGSSGTRWPMRSSGRRASSVCWPAGADPNRPNVFGKTPLMVAAHLNRIDSARKLLSAGARVDAVTGKVVEGCGFVSFSADHATMEAYGPDVCGRECEPASDEAAHRRGRGSQRASILI